MRDSLCRHSLALFVQPLITLPLAHSPWHSNFHLSLSIRNNCLLQGLCTTLSSCQVNIYWDNFDIPTSLPCGLCSNVTLFDNLAIYPGKNITSSTTSYISSLFFLILFISIWHVIRFLLFIFFLHHWTVRTFVSQHTLLLA